MLESIVKSETSLTFCAGLPSHSRLRVLLNLKPLLQDHIGLRHVIGLRVLLNRFILRINKELIAN